MTKVRGSRNAVNVPGQGVFEISETPKHELGTRMHCDDGRTFIYSKAGSSALSAGKLNMMPASVANHHDIRVAAAVAIGATTVTATLGATAATLDQYAGGYMAVIAGTGLGQCYRIKGNTATDASGVITITLEDDVLVALSASDSDLDLMPNPYNAVTETATEESCAAGVAPVAVTASYYFWNQTWGPAAVLAGDTAAAGTICEHGDTAGELLTYSAATKGGMMALAWGEAHAAGEYNFYILRISP